MSSKTASSPYARLRSAGISEVKWTCSLWADRIQLCHREMVSNLWRILGNPEYLDLARRLIDIRDLAVDGTDHNQDRIPFRQQTKAVGHAVRANYVYAGVAEDRGRCNAQSAVGTGR